MRTRHACRTAFVVFLTLLLAGAALAQHGVTRTKSSYSGFSTDIALNEWVSPTKWVTLSLGLTFGASGEPGNQTPFYQSGGWISIWEQMDGYSIVQYAYTYGEPRPIVEKYDKHLKGTAIVEFAVESYVTTVFYDADFNMLDYVNSVQDLHVRIESAPLGEPFVERYTNTYSSTNGWGGRSVYRYRGIGTSCDASATGTLWLTPTGSSENLGDVVRDWPLLTSGMTYSSNGTMTLDMYPTPPAARK